MRQDGQAASEGLTKNVLAFPFVILLRSPRLGGFESISTLPFCQIGCNGAHLRLGVDAFLPATLPSRWNYS